VEGKVYERAIPAPPQTAGPEAGPPDSVELAHLYADEAEKLKAELKAVREAEAATLKRAQALEAELSHAKQEAARASEALRSTSHTLKLAEEMTHRYEQAQSQVAKANAALREEQEVARVLRKELGAKPSETFTEFVRRLAAGSGSRTDLTKMEIALRRSEEEVKRLRTELEQASKPKRGRPPGQPNGLGASIKALQHLVDQGVVDPKEAWAKLVAKYGS